MLTVKSWFPILLVALLLVPAVAIDCSDPESRNAVQCADLNLSGGRGNDKYYANYGSSRPIFIRDLGGYDKLTIVGKSISKPYRSGNDLRITQDGRRITLVNHFGYGRIESIEYKAPGTRGSDDNDPFKIERNVQVDFWTIARSPNGQFGIINGDLTISGKIEDKGNEFRTMTAQMFDGSEKVGSMSGAFDPKNGAYGISVTTSKGSAFFEARTETYGGMVITEYRTTATDSDGRQTSSGDDDSDPWGNGPAQGPGDGWGDGPGGPDGAV